MRSSLPKDSCRVHPRGPRRRWNSLSWRTAGSCNPLGTTYVSCSAHGRGVLLIALVHEASRNSLLWSTTECPRCLALVQEHGRKYSARSPASPRCHRLVLKAPSVLGISRTHLSTP